LGAQSVAAIRTGDVEALRAALAADPELARARPDGQRTLLHVLTDWPGHLPRAVETLAVLLAAGADVDARFGGNGETALMWAASSDDVPLIDGLLDAGADIEATGAVIGGGTALDDAWAFGQWKAARRLVERGARPTLLAAAALGLELDADGDVTHAFWAACYGGQREAAEALLARGADPRWVGWNDLTPELAARRAGAVDLADWVAALPR
jgi:ankyrin repeat protein